MGQYQASKLAAHTATLDYLSSQKPRYSVVTIHPVFVFGYNILQTSADELAGTNGMLFGSLYAKEPMFAPYRDVRVLDVAEAHIRALDLEDAPMSSFLLSGKDRPWEDVLEHVKKEFPDAGFQTEPKTGDRWFVDTTRAEAQLGFKTWREMEVQVKDVVSQQLELRSS
jgi:nucleoside-diphosphate-sugar epimerase